MKRVVALLPVLIAFQAGAPPALAWTWPVDGPVLQPFVLGDDPYAAEQHRGVDVAAPTGGARQGAGARHGLVCGHRARWRPHGDDPDGRRLLGHARPPRLRRRRARPAGRRGRGRRLGRSVRRAGARRVVRPLRRPRNGGSQRLRRSARAPALAASPTAAVAGPSGGAGARRTRASADAGSSRGSGTRARGARAVAATGGSRSGSGAGGDALRGTPSRGAGGSGRPGRGHRARLGRGGPESCVRPDREGARAGLRAPGQCLRRTRRRHTPSRPPVTAEARARATPSLRSAPWRFWGWRASAGWC